VQGGARMKTKLIGVSTVILLVAGLAMAQTSEVSSVNVVGYIKVPLVANRVKLIGIQFDSMTTTNPTVADVFGSEGLPDGTVVYLFRGNRYVAEEYYDGFGWFPGTNLLDRGEGCWIKSPQNYDLTLLGEVPGEDTTVYLRAGAQIMSYPFPVSIGVTSTVLNVNAPDGSVVYLHDGTNYQAYEYYEGFGWFPDTLRWKEGEGCWFMSPAATSMVETVPYSL